LANYISARVRDRNLSSSHWTLRPEHFARDVRTESDRRKSKAKKSQGKTRNNQLIHAMLSSSRAVCCHASIVDHFSQCRPPGHLKHASAIPVRPETAGYSLISCGAQP